MSYTQVLPEIQSKSIRYEHFFTPSKKNICLKNDKVVISDNIYFMKQWVVKTTEFREIQGYQKYLMQVEEIHTSRNKRNTLPRKINILHANLSNKHDRFPSNKFLAYLNHMNIYISMIRLYTMDPLYRMIYFHA